VRVQIRQLVPVVFRPVGPPRCGIDGLTLAASGGSRWTPTPTRPGGYLVRENPRTNSPNAGRLVRARQLPANRCPAKNASINFVASICFVV
jgi:hypothetical protein